MSRKGKGCVFCWFRMTMKAQQNLKRTEIEGLAHNQVYCNDRSQKKNQKSKIKKSKMAKDSATIRVELMVACRKPGGFTSIYSHVPDQLRGLALTFPCGMGETRLGTPFRRCSMSGRRLTILDYIVLFSKSISTAFHRLHCPPHISTTYSSLSRE